MSTTQTQLFDPPAQSKAVDDKGRLAPPLRMWLFSVQMLLPLVLIDTTAGPVTIALPPAGLDTTTGQSNQNMELTYRRFAGGNNATITGSADGNQTLTANSSAGSVVKFKSNGVSWYVSQWP